MAAFTGQATLNGLGGLSGLLAIRSLAVTPLKDYSGVVINLNAAPTGSQVVTSRLYQEFFLPSDFTRGATADEETIPQLTGIQLFVGIDSGYASTATLDWQLQHYIVGSGWATLGQDTAIQTHSDGNKLWFDIYFDNAVNITSDMLDDRFRFNFIGRTVSAQAKAVPVTYDGSEANVNGVRVPAKLRVGVPFAFDYLGTPAFLLLDVTGGVTYSIQQGVNKVWFNSPNPLTNVNQAKAYLSDGVTPLLDGQGNQTSFMFRVLASTADSGIDFLGNAYRSAIHLSAPTSVTTFDTSVSETFWMSKPNPSRFAVENLYFDLRDDSGAAQVIDSVLLDPLTPGVFFSIYFSNEAGTPGTTDDWDEKLWTRVPKTYQMVKRDTYALPVPVSAQFVKIEFSHLQAQHYAPGNFQSPITYRKHPKWVLDYFLLTAAQQQEFIATSVGVTFNALNLAYNYYLDDLKQEPDQPIALDPSQERTLDSFLSQTNDASDQIDPTTLSKINLTLQPFQDDPVLKADFGQILGQFVIASRDTSGNVPTEGIVDTSTDTSAVSSLNRDAVVLDNNFPVMFFFVQCRHLYREISATFSHDRAYFVGVKELAFQRQQFSSAFDQALYTENIGDNTNLDRNDFAIQDSTWLTYTP